MSFCILLDDYKDYLYFNGFSSYNVGYYNYISIWPCYIIIHMTNRMLHNIVQLS